MVRPTVCNSPGELECEQRDRSYSALVSTRAKVPRGPNNRGKVKYYVLRPTSERQTARTYYAPANLFYDRADRIETHVSGDLRLLSCRGARL